jgi:hypothetical protein
MVAITILSIVLVHWSDVSVLVLSQEHAFFWQLLWKVIHQDFCMDKVSATTLHLLTKP